MKAKSIMIAGTMSSAGKSFITAGLCRIFRQDGYKTAPFKAQNMALNSYVTADGLEIGRAQAMQAEAAGIMPDIRMNPILLKPVSEKGSQVIVNGEVTANMNAAEYYRHKTDFIPYIMNDYNSLADEYDIIVLEGAGSPAEINLKSVDIVNMGMAKMSNSPVLLVGDIDRGGVFASLYGTVELMDDYEKSMIKGLIINKFRGDISILQSGLDMIEKLTSKPVLGTVPFIQTDIDDEDSLSERLLSRNSGSDADIAVIRLPHISNFTDFNVFGIIDGVSVRYVSQAHELGSPDLIIIPGTKNTMADLLWLRQSGLEAMILKKNSMGIPVFGICGGFQMLGRKISDPYDIENGGSLSGMCLLDTETVFKNSKKRSLAEGRTLSVDGIFKSISEIHIRGYEIHMGKTVKCGGNAVPFTVLDDGKTDGFRNSGSTVFGSYLHGIFDNEEFVRRIISAVLSEKGLDRKISAFNLKEYKEKQYDILADELRKALDMDKIYKILNEGL